MSDKNVDPVPGGVDDEDSEDDEPAQYLSPWVQFEKKKPDASKPGQTNSFYWYRAAPGVVFPPQPEMNDPPLYMPFKHPNVLKPEEAPLFLSKQDWRVLRLQDPGHLPVDWPNVYETKLTVPMRDAKGGLFTFDSFKTNKPPGTFEQDGEKLDKSPYWVDFWDSMFNSGQELGAFLKDNLGRVPGWRLYKPPGAAAKWKKRVGGRYTADNDGRTWEERDDLIAFMPRGEADMPDMTDIDYVKLRYSSIGQATGEARLLLLNDLEARKRGVKASQVYVPESVMEQLRGPSGTYPWKERGNSVAIRDGQGKIQVIQCASRDLREQKFWERAYFHGLTLQEGRSVRSRNVGGLDLRFVVNDGNQGLTDTALNDIVRQATQAAVVPIKQTATAVTRSAFASSKSDYFPLSTSPFGDYETWIKWDDYASYLRKYSGYNLPDDPRLTLIAQGFEEVRKKQGPTAKGNEEKFIERQKAAPRVPGDNKIAGVHAGIVSIDTVRQAMGARKSPGMPTQGDQMGGSATTVAKWAGWNNPFDRVTSEIDGDIQWDAPGVYPAEWLHRSAFSWGNELGSDMSQSNTNIIFGSSEANSLMTRYEKAWQSLFTAERRVQLARSSNDPSKCPALKGILTTMNTHENQPIVQHSVSGNQVSILTLQKSGDRTLSINNVPASPDGGVFPDYWKAARTNPNLSFSLTYQLVISNTAPGALGLPVPYSGVIFFPFQRGFFTRLEAEVDALLLRRWADNQIASLAPQAAPAPAPAPPAPTPVKPLKMLTINRLAATVVRSSSRKALTLDSEGMVSPLPPSRLPHADMWRAITSGDSVHVGGVTLRHPNIASLDEEGRMLHIPVKAIVSPTTDAPTASLAAANGETRGDSRGKVVQAVVARAPLRAQLLPAAASSEAPSKATVIPVPAALAELGNDNTIPPGFVLNGTVQLFGLFEQQIYVLYGTPTEGVRQILPIKEGTLKISDYIPGLAGTDFDALQLRNTQLVYNQLTTATNATGTWLQTDLVFSGVLEPVRNFLQNVCHQDHPAVRVEAFLSPNNDWTRPFNPNGLHLRGMLPNMSAKVGDILEITELGISVGLGRYREVWPPYTEKWSHSLGFFGKMNIDLPNDMAPMNVEFSMLEADGNMTLIASVPDRESSTLGFAGIEGLKLSSLTMSTCFAISASPSILNFAASANLVLRESVIKVRGFYARSDWGFRCDMDKLSLQDLADLYEDLFDSPLHVGSHSVVLEDLFFMVGPAGITISGSVTVEGYTSAKATVSLGRAGVHIAGEVDDIHLESNVTLKKAALDISLSRKESTAGPASPTSWKFAILGTVAIAGTEVSASLFLDKDSSGKLSWTLFGSFDGDFRLSAIAPPLKGTFLDLALHEAALIVSNVDGAAATGALIPAAFSVIKGVQIAANLGSIPALDGAIGNKGAPTTGLTLSAMYDADTSSFGLGIRLATPQQMSMKSGTVTSGPISLNILISTMPTLVLQADFFVKVPNQAAPLKFSGGLSLNIKEADLFVKLENQWWENPFGLSDQLRLGPDLALQVGIVYAGPLYPSEIGIAAGLAVGSVSGKAALSISEDPSNELIMMKIQNLGIRDLVEFASLLYGSELPMPLEDFLRFKDLEFYLSGGATVAGKVYPPGASFNCDAVIFDHEAKVYVGVNKAVREIQVKGSLQSFDIGPVSVSGSVDGTPVQLSLQFGFTSQTLLVDGRVTILDADVMIYVNVVLLPSPTFKLNTSLEFSSFLNFDLEASMRGPSLTGGLATLKTLEFDVHATFHQEILDYIATQMNTQILTAKHAVDDGIEKARHTLEVARAEFTTDVSQARAKLDQATLTYRTIYATAKDALEKEKTASGARTAELQAAVQNARLRFDIAVANAQRDLKIAADNSAREIGKAQQNVSDAKARGTADIQKHMDNLNRARDDMNRRFGDAIKKVEDAKAKVKGWEDSEREAQDKFNKLKKAADHASGLDKVTKGLDAGKAWAELQTAKRKLATANDVLNIAKATIEKAGYKAAAALVDQYQQDVETSKTAAKNLLDAANKTLEETSRVQSGLVATAQKTLQFVQTSGVECQLFNAAVAALAAYQKSEVAVLGALQATIDSLSNTTEAVALSAAYTALRLAVSNTSGIDAATAALKVAGESARQVLAVGEWVTNNTVNILNLRSAEVSGDFRAMCLRERALAVKVQGTFAYQEVDLSVQFWPGQGVDFVKALFERLIDEVKKGGIKIGK